MGGFEQGFQFGTGQAAQQAATRQSYDMLNRKLLASQLESVANQALPPAQIKDEKTGNMVPNPDYQKAFQQRLWANEQMEKVYSPEHHANLFDFFHGLITGRQEGAPAPGKPSGPPTPPGAPTGAPSATAGHPFVESHVLKQGDRFIHALGQHLKAAAHPIAKNPPVQGESLPQMLAGLPNPGQVAFQRKAQLQAEAEAARLAEVKERGSNPSGRPVPFGRGSLSVKDAQELAESGHTFNDQEGNAIDVSILPDTAKITPWAWGNRIFYTIGDQVPRVVTADNQRTVQPEEGALSPAGEAPTLGQARVPTTSVTTATAPGGGQVVTGTRTSTPISQSRQQAPIVSKPSGPISAKSPKVPETGQSILPNIQNMTPQNAAAARKAMPAVTAELGLFGDPEKPNVKSLADFSELANDPHAQNVLGEAFKLLDQEMGEISDPGVIQTLGTAAGWANFRAQAEAGAQQAAGTEMTAQEREYFDIAIASMADIIGARSATGQSPAQFSVRAIQNELPRIGLSGTPDSASYLTKMNTISRQIEVGLTGMPDNSRALAWLLKRQNDLVRQGNSASRKLNPRSTKSPIVPPPRPANVPDGYVFRNGSKGLGWYAPKIQ